MALAYKESIKMAFQKER